MFSIEQIDDLHHRLGAMKSFLKYVQALKELGVVKYHSYLADGHSEYFGAGSYRVESKPVHEKLTIADKTDREAFLEHLSLHNQGKTNYMGMSRGLAESGIDRWTVDTTAETISFCDKAGNVLLTEKIE
jgi:uncharacterized protein YbcV (DUF1398 family)